MSATYTGKLEGYLRVDQFGRLYIDKCPTDEEHLISSPPPGQERHTCRRYLDDMMLIVETDLGKRVKLKYEIHIEQCEEHS